MGCSASRLDTLIAKAIEEPSYSYSYSSTSTSSISSNNSSSRTNSSSNVPKTVSLSTPMIHHPAIQKGDSNHIVCLTSSTYGSLIVGNSDQCDDADDFSGRNSPDSVINTWELMEGLEDEEITGNDSFMLKNEVLSNFKTSQKLPISKLGLNLSDSMMKLNDSYVFVEMSDEIVEENPSSNKPLWKHLSEESLLSKMDPNVCNAYDRALLAKKLGYSKSSKVTKSVSSSPIVSKSKSMGSTTPMVSKFDPDKDEDKIVLYFTSLRGIRKTYEDCSSVRMILRGFRVVVDEKDISMDSTYKKELQCLLNGKALSLPQLFIRGKHIGGAEDVMLLHESGELEKILEGCRKKECGAVCKGCGDARFVPCSNCNGSRKMFLEEEGRIKRCCKCNENGLVRCPGCCS